MNGKKRIGAAAAALLMFLLSACGEVTETAMPEIPTVDPAEFERLEERIAAAKTHEDIYVYLINAQSDGETQVPIEGETELSVQAVVPEGMKLRQWTVNGVSLNTLEESIRLTVSENTVIQAELRPVKKVTGIGCTMQFLDENEEGQGESFTEFTFEEDYRNPVTGETCRGGSMLLCVQTEIPAGKVLDHWRINGQEISTMYGTPYIFNSYVTQTTTFEPVFIDK